MIAKARQIGLNCTPGLGNCVAQSRQQVREPSRCTRSEELSHHQAEVEGRCVYEESLPDVVIASHMQSSHGTGLVTMSKGSFQELTPTG